MFDAASMPLLDRDYLPSCLLIFGLFVLTLIGIGVGLGYGVGYLIHG